MKTVLFYINGKLEAHIEQLFDTEYRWPGIATNGAEVAASRISDTI